MESSKAAPAAELEQDQKGDGLMHSLPTLLRDLYIVEVNIGAYRYLQLLVTETGTLSTKSQCILISQK